LAQAAAAGPTVIRERGGEIGALKPIGEHVLVGVGGRVLVLETGGSTPIGEAAPLQLPVQAMDAAGDWVAVVGGRPGSRGALSVLDVADPRRPVIVGRAKLARFARSVAIERRANGSLWAWVPQGPDGLWAYEMNGGSAPRLVLRWRPSVDVGSTLNVVDVTSSPQGVAAVVGPDMADVNGPVATEVHSLRVDDRGTVELVAMRSFGGLAEEWFVAPEHVVHADRQWLRVMAVEESGSLAPRSAVRRRSAQLVGVAVVGERLAVAYATGADKETLELDVHVLDDGRELASGKLASIPASSWRVAAGHGEDLLIGSWDAVNRVSLAPRPSLTHGQIVSQGRYVDLQPYGDEWLALTEKGDLQRLDAQLEILDQGLIDEPLAKVLVMGRRLLGLAGGGRFVVLDEVVSPTGGPAWRLGEETRWRRVDWVTQRPAASGDLVVVFGMHGNSFTAAHWRDGRLRGHSATLRGPRLPLPPVGVPPPFLVIEGVLWVGGGPLGPLAGYQWPSNTDPTAIAVIGAGLPLVPTTLGGDGGRFLVGDRTAQVVAVDARTALGGVEWRLDLPGAPTHLAVSEDRGWAAWSAPEPGLAAMTVGNAGGAPLGEAPLGGEPRAIVARGAQLWVVQAGGAVSEYEVAVVGPVRTATTPSATPAATATTAATTTTTPLPAATATATATAAWSRVRLVLPWAERP
jgi:hypothetical protein